MLAPSFACWSTGSRESAKSEPSTSVWRKSWNKPNNTWCWSRTSGPGNVSESDHGLHVGEIRWLMGKKDLSSSRHHVSGKFFETVALRDMRVLDGWEPPQKHQQHCHCLCGRCASLLFIQCPSKLFDILSVCFTLSWAAAGLRGGLPGVSGGSGDSDGQTGDESELLQSPPHDDHLLRRVLETSVDGQTLGELVDKQANWQRS